MMGSERKVAVITGASRAITRRSFEPAAIAIIVWSRSPARSNDVHLGIVMVYGPHPEHAEDQFKSGDIDPAAARRRRSDKRALARQLGWKLGRRRCRKVHDQVHRTFALKYHGALGVQARVVLPRDRQPEFDSKNLLRPR
jgi:hypothetical protein